MSNTLDIEELTKLLQNARLEYIETTNTIREKYEQCTDTIQRQIDKLRQQQKRTHPNKRTRNKIAKEVRQTSNKEEIIRIRDTVEIRNRYGDSQGESAFGIRGIVIRTTRARVVLQNNNTRKTYTHARNNLLKIPKTEIKPIT
jgi:hypothetical protein